ncbi:hypothetical protein ACFY40_11685 [Streptomyces sp. NPDC012950]|uniref:hypothetical protein n=1 Tax=Streptomyces sp. NPDC012950 TaxID=3364858 RepID=UPI0036AB1021
MPTSDPYGQSINIAALTDAPDAETLAHGIVDAVAPRLNLRFASAAARAAQLVGAAAPVPGMYTYLVAEDRYDVRMADGTWQALSPGAWIPLSFAAGYAARTGLPSYRIVNGSVEFRGTFQRSAGGAFTKGATFTIMTLPAAARPTSFRYFIARTEWAADMYGGVEVAIDGTVNVGIPNTAGTAASWMSLDAIRYSLT